MRLRYGENFAGTTQAVRYGETRDARRRDASPSIPPAMCSAPRRSRSSATGCASSPPATTRTSPIRPARRSSSSPATCSSPRRPSACRCSATAIRTARSPSSCTRSRCFPSARTSIGAYSLGKAQRVIALIRKAGYDKPIYLHGAMETHHALLREPRHRPRRAARGARRQEGELAGAIALCPPSALQELWSRRFPDPVSSFASGWMRVRARARQRGVELPLVISDHADWDGLTRHHRRDRRRRNLGDARPGGRAGALVPARAG